VGPLQPARSITPQTPIKLTTTQLETPHQPPPPVAVFLPKTPRGKRTLWRVPRRQALAMEDTRVGAILQVIGYRVLPRFTPGC